MQLQNEISAKQIAVATEHPEAAAAARIAFERGGNAVDAAVAAMMALCVVMPGSVGFGGYGGTMVGYDAKGRRLYALDFDSRAPLAYRPELYADPAAARRGYLSVSVPGTVAGLDLALKRFGNLGWSACAAHAAALAEDGFAVGKNLASSLGDWAKRADRDSLAAVFPDGNSPAEGQRWAQPDLAKLIRRLGDDPRVFYDGEVAKTIARQVRKNGGILSERDLAEYQAEGVEPLRATYRGHELYTPPPPAGGVTTLCILKTMERFDLSRHEPWGAPYFELFLESARLCWQERARHLGDPRFVQAPLDALLSDGAAAERAKRVLTRDAGPAIGPKSSGGAHTCNVVAADAQGNVASLTATHGDGFGSRVAVKGLGLFLGHGMSRFDHKPGSPNAPAPGKRMQHNMAPLLVCRDDRWHAAIGMPGGTRIVTVTAQLALSLLEFKAPAGRAASAPRVHAEADGPFLLSASIPAEVAGELEFMGHTVERGQYLGGPANVVLRAPSGGTLTAACSAGVQGLYGS